MIYQTIATKIPILQQTQSFEWKNSDEFTTVPAAVLDRASTTAKMRKTCQSMDIQLLTAHWEEASSEEYQSLNLSDSTRTFIREVAILCDEIIWMYGRCVIPSSTLTDEEVELIHLGTRPLGDYLYSHKNLHRDEFKIAYSKENWLRQSIVSLSNKPLLLTEVFMPEMLQHV